MARLLPVEGAYNNVIHFVGGETISVHVKDELTIGRGVMMSPDIEIGFPDKPVNRFIVGDYSRLYTGQFASRNFICGDYVTIHEGAWAYGRNDIVIGHNAWFGRRCTLDAEGGYWVGNGFAAGQDSHMWSHIRHGDTLVGNRWLKFGQFVAHDDVWLVGRCTSAPAEHGDRSMGMVEANLTKGMPADTVWGGNPAKDMTEKFGEPFVNRTLSDMRIDFNERLDKFQAANSDVDFHALTDLAAQFDLASRTYKKTHDPVEVRLMRYLLPEAKFVPWDATRVDL